MPHRGKQLAHAERQRRHSSAPRPPAGTKHERDLFAGSAKSECAQGVEQRGAKPRTDPQRGELSRAARHGGRTHPRRPHRRPSKMHPRNGFPAGHCRRGEHLRQSRRRQQTEHPWQTGNLRQPLPWTTASRRHRENAFPRMTPWDLPRKAEAAPRRSHTAQPSASRCRTHPNTLRLAWILPSAAIERRAPLPSCGHGPLRSPPPRRLPRPA